MDDQLRIAVLGGGSWATALVKIFSSNAPVGWWVRSIDDVAHIQRNHHNPRYLSDVELHMDRIDLHSDLMTVVKQTDILVLAVPSAFMVDALAPLKDILQSKRVISAVKGIVPETHQIVGEYLRDHMGLDMAHFGAIVGACHAEEVALERLSYLTVAAQDGDLAKAMAKRLQTDHVHVSTMDDVVGCEYAAVLKNIYAIAAGLAHGLGYGDNFQAVLVSNAQREMKRFMKAVYPMKRKITHTAYSSDLFVTMYSPFSRNRTLGHLVGKGYSLKSAMAEIGMVAEGYYAAKHIWEVKKDRAVKMPVASAVHKVLYRNMPPQKALQILANKLI